MNTCLRFRKCYHFDHVGFGIHVERERVARFRAGFGHHTACRANGGLFRFFHGEFSWFLFKALADDRGRPFRVGHVGTGPDSAKPFEAWTAFDLVHGPLVM